MHLSQVEEIQISRIPLVTYGENYIVFSLITIKHILIRSKDSLRKIHYYSAYLCHRVLWLCINLIGIKYVGCFAM